MSMAVPIPPSAFEDCRNGCFPSNWRKVCHPAPARRIPCENARRWRGESPTLPMKCKSLWIPYCGKVKIHFPFDPMMMNLLPLVLQRRPSEVLRSRGHQPLEVDQKDPSPVLRAVLLRVNQQQLRQMAMVVPPPPPPAAAWPYPRRSSDRRFR